MLPILRKKKTEEKVANFFINSLIDSVELGFPEVAALINEDPEFVSKPTITADDSDKFLMIIIAGNIKIFTRQLVLMKCDNVIPLVIKKLSVIYGQEEDSMKRVINDFHSYFSRINYPSKNIHYAMSKAIFYQYGLNKYQKDYFKNLNTPNPIFLKRLDEIIANFILNWEDFFDKYKIV